MSEENNGQLRLFDDEADNLEVGDQFVDGDGNVYTIVSLFAASIQGWLLVKRSKRSKWAEVAYAIKNDPSEDWEKEMSEFIDKKQLIKLEDKEDD